MCHTDGQAKYRCNFLMKRQHGKVYKVRYLYRSIDKMIKNNTVKDEDALVHKTSMNALVHQRKESNSCLQLNIWHLIREVFLELL